MYSNNMQKKRDENMKNMSFIRKWKAEIISIFLVFVFNLIFTVGGILLSMTDSIAQTYNLAEDFSPTNNPNGVWSYGFSDKRGGDFKLYPLNFKKTIEIWANSSDPNPLLHCPEIFYNPTSSIVSYNYSVRVQPNKVGFHPGPKGENSVIRWTAPISGEIQIDAVFTGIDIIGPTTTDVAILHGLTELWSVNINTYNIPIPVSKSMVINTGETIDFTVGYGSNGTFWCDSTGIDVNISYKNATLSLPETKTCPGNSVSMPITLGNPAGKEIGGKDITVAFDPALLQPMTEAVTLTGTVLDGKGYDLDYNVVNGEIRIGIYAKGETFFTGSGIIAYLNFDVTGTGNADLTFTKGLLNESPIDTKNGKVEIENCCEISGKVVYYSDMKLPVPDVTVTAKGDGIIASAITDDDGNYTLSVPCGLNYTVTLSKNDHIGGISSLDTSIIARYLAGFSDAALDCLQIIAANVNIDSVVDAVDASRVARYSVGKIEYMNDAKIDWVFTPYIPDICSIIEKKYQPLNESMTDQDFIAIRLGDVSGNWTTTSERAKQPRSKMISYQSRSAVSDKSGGSEYRMKVLNGSKLIIPVILNQPDDIQGIDIDASFDPSMLKFTGATLANGILDNSGYRVIFNSDSSGTLKIAVSANIDIVRDSGNILNLMFDVIGKGTSVISLTGFDCNEESADGGFSMGNGVYDSIKILTK